MTSTATMWVAAVPVFVWAGGGNAQVVPDGQTNTTVSTGVDGRQTVNIAPTKPGGLSYNSYNGFSVAKPGLNLDNRVRGARTIVNEVVSSARSRIEGPVEVLGSSAHVILANPNGITINGGSFVNTGGVVLGAGKVDLRSLTLAPGLTQTNAQLTIGAGAGDVLIAPGGLSGTMPVLQVYAGRIKVDGPVTVSPAISTRGRGEINLQAGKSSVEFDSSVLPIAALSNWARHTREGTGSSEVLVDVTANGSLDASRVVVGVTEKGAGVSFAGRGLASAGEFRIDGSGKVDFAGAKITSATNVRVEGSAITVLNADARQSELIAVNGALSLIARDGDLRNVGGLLQGARHDPDASLSSGGVTLSATGDVELLSDNADNLAIAFSSHDDLSVTAGGNIRNTAGRFLSNASTRLAAGGDLFNGVAGGKTDAGEPILKSGYGPRRWYRLFSRQRLRTVGVDYGSTGVPGEVGNIVGNEIEITAANVFNRGGNMIANSEALHITTPGVVISEAVLSGSAEISRKCFWRFCRSSTGSTVELNGGRLNAGGKIEIEAGGEVINRGGQWLAFGDVDVTAPMVRSTGLPIIFVTERPGGIGSAFKGNAAWYYIEDQGGQIISADGEVRVASDNPVELTGAELTGAGGLDVPSGINVVREPRTVSPVPSHHIGLLWSWLDTMFEQKS